MQRRCRQLILAFTSAFISASAATGCSDDGASGGGTTGAGTGSSGGADDNLTLPVTSAPPGDDGGIDSGSGGPADPTDATGAMDPDSSGPGSGSGSEGSSSGGSEGDSSTGGVPAVTIDWCRLQSPPEVTVAIDEPFTVYGRVYVEGVTDQSVGNDPYRTLVAEVGWGPDASDPAAGDWAFIPATPNPGWDGTTFGEPNNDEYMADLAIDTAGTWDYAFRFSGDGGSTWAYCDLDDLLTGGYTPDQAGTATVPE